MPFWVFSGGAHRESGSRHGLQGLSVVVDESHHSIAHLCLRSACYQLTMNSKSILPFLFAKRKARKETSSVKNSEKHFRRFYLFFIVSVCLTATRRPAKVEFVGVW